eukprot:Sdes_comp19909_c0_seq1m12322
MSNKQTTPKKRFGYSRLSEEHISRFLAEVDPKDTCRDVHSKPKINQEENTCTFHEQITPVLNNGEHSGSTVHQGSLPEHSHKVLNECKKKAASKEPQGEERSMPKHIPDTAINRVLHRIVEGRRLYDLEKEKKKKKKKNQKNHSRKAERLCGDLCIKKAFTTKATESVSSQMSSLYDARTLSLKNYEKLEEDLLENFCATLLSCFLHYSLIH